MKMKSINIIAAVVIALCSTIIMKGTNLNANNNNVMEHDGVKIEFLGDNNTLVRVTGDGRYLMLPIQERHDDATINILVDGKVEKTIYARLAKTKVQYSVPLDLKEYKGRTVLLNVETKQGRQNIRETQDDVCWKNMKLADTLDLTNTEKYRPLYHHTPQYGWMNDPNGMFYKDGVWHLYFQWNPYGSKWQNMTWGHSKSTDLVHWTPCNTAIEPNGLGSVFSGSCALDTGNTAGFGEDAVIAMYTSAGLRQCQSLAYSLDDGETFHIYEGNPVITRISESRDPNMFYNPATDEWNLVLAHALDREMIFYTSKDMKSWTYVGAFGKGLGAQGGVWECPDMFELPIEGSNKCKWVLVCNINPGGPFGGSATQYFVGEWDGKTFKADKEANGTVPTKWLDFGKDYYATVSWSDTPRHRRTVIGWMSNWQYAADVPTHQYRSANTLPRDLSLFKAPDGKLYVASRPSAELDGIRGDLRSQAQRVQLGETPYTLELPADNDGVCEIIVDIDGGKAQAVNLVLSNEDGENVVMIYDPSDHTISFDRRESGNTDFSDDFESFTVAPTFEKNRKVSLRIYIDKSSIEIFEKDGKFAMTNLVFPTKPYSTISISSTGGNARGDVKVYSLKF